MTLAASAVRDVERLLNQVTQLRHYNGLGGLRWNHYVENELKASTLTVLPHACMQLAEG